MSLKGLCIENNVLPWLRLCFEQVRCYSDLGIIEKVISLLERARFGIVTNKEDIV
jgi:hypothetical protein